MSDALLVTADGQSFPGRSAGVAGIGAGELVFTTSMSGYQEVLTDPSYAGQVIAFTAPHVGNYGTTPDDDQSDRSWVEAFVARDIQSEASSWRSHESFDSWVRARNIVAIDQVDTRRLTRHVRERGAMSVATGSDADSGDLLDAARAVQPMAGRDLVSGVTTSSPYRLEPAGTRRGHVVVVDYGVKRDILLALASRGMSVTVVPADSTSDEIEALRPHGLLLSNGPGDPQPLTGAVTTVRHLLGRVPMLGVCLGHQVMALALGLGTFKLPFGHHGSNHPVRRVGDGRVVITAQNHGFAVDPGEKPCRSSRDGPPRRFSTPLGPVVETHRNLSDGTIEGFECEGAAAMAVQFHPEAGPGPGDAAVVFDRFLSLVGRR